MTAQIIVFPGTNRERDLGRALHRITGKSPGYVWHGSEALPDKTSMILLPGGFSYGDYLRSGAMAAHSPIMGAVRHAANQGLPVIGICNGFQILCESRLLPGALLRNRSLHFACKTVYLRKSVNSSPLLAGMQDGQVIRVPIAHGEGRYYADEATLEHLRSQGRIAFQYCNREGISGDAANPNGSVGDIAGITNEKGNVLGLMPHPENAVEDVAPGKDGTAFFESVLNSLRC